MVKLLMVDTKTSAGHATFLEALHCVLFLGSIPQIKYFVGQASKKNVCKHISASSEQSPWHMYEVYLTPPTANFRLRQLGAGHKLSLSVFQPP